MRFNRLPYVKTLAGFDFTFQPSIKREQIAALHERGFLERQESVPCRGRGRLPAGDPQQSACHEDHAPCQLPRSGRGGNRRTRTFSMPETGTFLMPVDNWGGCGRGRVGGAPGLEVSLVAGSSPFALRSALREEPHGRGEPR